MESYWEKERQRHDEFEPIKSDIDVSTCIIGGGFTGLTAGYYLSKEISVAVVEKNRICSHTSGKNTGKITCQHGLFYDYLIQSKGKEFAKKYFSANENAINNIENIIKEEQVECDFEREQSYVFTQKEGDFYKIEHEQKSVKRINPDISKIVKNIELPVQNLVGAIEFKNQAKFHPLKYGYGLAKAIIKNEGIIFENTQVTNIKSDGDKYIVYANQNRIIADNVIIATRYPIINIPGFHFLKMYQSTSYAIVCDVKDKLFDGMYINVEVPQISFRVINEGERKLLLAVGYDYKTGTEQLVNGYTMLENAVKKMYPNVEVIYKWSAEDCISLDKIPYIGQFSKLKRNMYVATGYNKWGITSSNIAGQLIADDILGKENEYAEIFDSKRMEPVKNRQEVGNMLKEVNESLIMSRFEIPKSKIKDIKVGQGKVIEIDHTKVGVYKADNGEIFKIKPVCSHLGCELYFNNVEKTWECPCHGSKFTYDGISIETPSNKNITTEIIPKNDGTYWIKNKV